ncbi:unnamed protein product [Amoebophrya sp. A120]|nr:unnamed protein product [Amoebophrya sp. A120]|eukprot:GSA120T00015922001.1
MSTFVSKRTVYVFLFTRVIFDLFPASFFDILQRDNYHENFSRLSDNKVVTTSRPPSTITAYALQLRPRNVAARTSRRILLTKRSPGGVGSTAGTGSSPSTSRNHLRSSASSSQQQHRSLLRHDTEMADPNSGNNNAGGNQKDSLIDGNMEQDEDDKSQSSGSEDVQLGWISWFCSVPSHELFCEVDEDYIRDNFNLYGLRNRLQYYDHALDMVLMPDAPDEDDLQDADFLEVYRDAQDLYGLVHARYILSPRGLEAMREGYQSSIFGTCPRVKCHQQPVLPVGTSDELRVSRVKTYCPKCEQLYATKSTYSDIDGAYFGTSFPHVFLLTYPELVPLERPEPYVPRLFGFKLKQEHGLIRRCLAQQEKAEDEWLFKNGYSIKDVEEFRQQDGALSRIPNDSATQDGSNFPLSHQTSPVVQGSLNEQNLNSLNNTATNPPAGSSSTIVGGNPAGVLPSSSAAATAPAGNVGTTNPVVQGEQQ